MLNTGSRIAHELVFAPPKHDPLGAGGTAETELTNENK